MVSEGEIAMRDGRRLTFLKGFTSLFLWLESVATPINLPQY